MGMTLSAADHSPEIIPYAGNVKDSEDHSKKKVYCFSVHCFFFL